MKRKGIWKDVTCTYTMKFKTSEVSVPFKVDVYGKVFLILTYFTCSISLASLTNPTGPTFPLKIPGPSLNNKSFAKEIFE